MEEEKEGPGTNSHAADCVSAHSGDDDVLVDFEEDIEPVEEMKEGPGTNSHDDTLVDPPPIQSLTSMAKTGKASPCPWKLRRGSTQDTSVSSEYGGCEDEEDRDMIEDILSDDCVSSEYSNITASDGNENGAMSEATDNENWKRRKRSNSPLSSGRVEESRQERGDVRKRQRMGSRGDTIPPSSYSCHM
jgi:hypothetical protein